MGDIWICYIVKRVYRSQKSETNGELDSLIPVPENEILDGEE
jgi:hypothetical protein